MIDDRLIDIETRIAYQEDMLQQLNDVVAKQQKRIDLLEDVLRTLTERYPSLQAEATPALIEKPPHY